VSGSIFVVDASDHGRVAEAKEALNRVLEHEQMRGKPLLIFANKQDLEGAMNEDQLSGLLMAEAGSETGSSGTKVVSIVCTYLAN
jgi:signal recognition particle receptor subunit beta